MTTIQCPTHRDGNVHWNPKYGVQECWTYHDGTAFTHTVKTKEN